MINVDVRKELGRLHGNTVASLVELQKLLNAIKPVLVVDTIADMEEISTSALKEGDLIYVLDNDVGVPESYIYVNDAWTPFAAGGLAGARIRYDVGFVTTTASATGITASFSSPDLTLIVPSGVELYEAVVSGTSAYVTGGIFNLIVNYEWDNGYNTTVDDLLLGVPAIWDLTTFDIDGIARLVTPMSNPVEVSILSANTIQYTFHNLDLYPKWKLSLK